MIKDLFLASVLMQLGGQAAPDSTGNVIASGLPEQ
jgi:hypothetical protein